ncbi:MAG: NAD(P)-dependent alcohol dehydrogenase [Salinibacterium sp.]|nr:MAG: NAD(P)-dependent alcohol dehydrogenase [Salinibacterium sp.]
MKAIVNSRYGTPDVLALESVPPPRAGDVLVRVRAAVVTPPDCAARSGKPAFARLYFGLRRPRMTILGSLFAGEVVEVGKTANGWAVGDRVIGHTTRFGAHAEYIRVGEDAAIGRIPESISDESAVAIHDGAMTALPFLREAANLQAGQRVLVIGASGATGTAAVQLATHIGAHVTAVCSGRNSDLVRSLGAESVVDYTMEDFTRTGPYDVIFDTVNASSFGASKKALTRNGIYLTTVPSTGILLRTLTSSRSKGTRAAIAFTGLRSTDARVQDLATISELAASRALLPVIDRRYSLEETPEAHRHVETGHKRGSVVITP